MRLSRPQLKTLLESLILNEGRVEDLLAANPQLQPAIDARIKNPNQLLWLLKMEKFEPIADMVGLIPAFEQNKQRLTIKDLNAYRNPNDLRAALEALGESEGDKRRQLKESETDIVYEDDQWLVVMPHTMESSIQWGKGTTWCTAATKSGNLFYNYVGRKNQDIVLYYIIKKGSDSKVDPDAKMSVGFVGGEPVFSGESGGLTVNASNVGMTQASFNQILDSKFKPVMSAMKLHSKKISGQHPAKVAMQKIGLSKDSLVMLNKYTAGMKPDERSDFIKALLEYDVSAEVLSFFTSDKDPTVRKNVAKNPNTPAEDLVRLASDENEYVRYNTVINPNAPIEILTRLASDKSMYVVSYVAKNPNTPSEILTRLARHRGGDIRSSVAQNPNTPLKILIRFANSVLNDADVRSGVARNPSTPSEILTRLASDGSLDVKSSVAKNPNTPVEDLVRLASDEIEYVRNSVKKNPTYQKYLESQAQLTEYWIKLAGLKKGN